MKRQTRRNASPSPAAPSPPRRGPRRGCPRLLAPALVLLLGGCYKRATEIRVRDAGRVAVSAPAEGAWIPVLHGDGAHGVSVPLPPAPGVASRGVVMRQGGMISLEHGERNDVVRLVDPEGMFPRVKAPTGIEVRDGLLSAPYAFVGRRALEIDTTKRNATSLLLSTPVDNVVFARHLDRPQAWPGILGLALGGVFALAGSVLIFLPERDRDRWLMPVGYLFLVPGVGGVTFGAIWLAQDRTERDLLGGTYGSRPHAPPLP